jgi:hypothetical protein
MGGRKKENDPRVNLRHIVSTYVNMTMNSLVQFYIVIKIKLNSNPKKKSKQDNHICFHDLTLKT